MIHSETRPEVCSQYNFKFDLGASTLDAPPPQWEAQRPPGIELPSRLPAPVVDLCYRALDCRHVCTVANGPSRLRSPLLFAWISIFTFRFCSDTSANNIKIENHSMYDCAIRFCLDTPSELPLGNRLLVLLAGPFQRFLVFSISFGTFGYFSPFFFFRFVCAGVSGCWRVEGGLLGTLSSFSGLGVACASRHKASMNGLSFASICDFG